MKFFMTLQMQEKPKSTVTCYLKAFFASQTVLSQVDQGLLDVTEPDF